MHKPFHAPELIILHKGENDFSIRYGGRAVFSENKIFLMDYLLADKTEALGVVRHEFAHFLKEWLDLVGGHHGSGFNQALKLVSGKNWQKDKHWDETPAISRVIPKRKQAQHRLAIITNTCCNFTWRASRIESYIKRGLFACQRCKISPVTVKIKRV